MGQVLGWRSGFAIVAVLAHDGAADRLSHRANRVQPGASPLRELGALKRRQVWLTLATGAIGFGGLFAVYAYLASTLVAVTGVSPALVPVVLAVFGVGLTLGTLFAGWAADRALVPATAGMLLWSAFWLAAFPFAAGNIWAVSLVVFMIGAGGGLGAMLQTRLMDVADDAQTLAAALNHSAFNTANALGPWLGGMADRRRLRLDLDRLGRRGAGARRPRDLDRGGSRRPPLSGQGAAPARSTPALDGFSFGRIAPAAGPLSGVGCEKSCASPSCGWR